MLLVACAGLCGCVADSPGPVSAAVEPAPKEATGEAAALESAKLAPPPARSGRQLEQAPLPPPRPAFLDTAVAAGEPAELTDDEAAPPASESGQPAEPVVARAFAAAEPAPAPAATETPVPAAFAPAGSTRFDASRGGYGHAPPEPRVSEAGLQLMPPPGADDKQTTKRSATPGQRYYAAYENTIISCFPPRLREALNTIAEHYDRDVEVTSGLRHGGRRGSYHRRCMAADVRVPGVAPAALSAFVRTIQGVNGVGSYRHTSVTHLDIRDYQMSWRY